MQQSVQPCNPPGLDTISRLYSEQLKLLHTTNSRKWREIPNKKAVFFLRKGLLFCRVSLFIFGPLLYGTALDVLHDRNLVVNICSVQSFVSVYSTWNKHKKCWFPLDLLERHIWQYLERLSKIKTYKYMLLSSVMETSLVTLIFIYMAVMPEPGRPGGPLAPPNNLPTS